MKKKLALLLVVVAAAVMSTGCTEQERAKSFGGEYTLDLPVNQKLVNVTWKEDTLWYLTREMKPGETADRYEFKADSSYGIFEGTVHIIESTK